MLVYDKPIPHVQGGIYGIIYIRVNIFMINGINGINGSNGWYGLYGWNGCFICPKAKAQIPKYLRFVSESG